MGNQSRPATSFVKALAALPVGKAVWPGILILFGLILRLTRYLFDVSLYNDETSVVFNVLERGFSSLATPLDWDQAAPVAFLASVKLTSVLFGVSEYALRLVPLLSGLFSVVLFYVLAKRTLDPIPALFSILLFSACWRLANYSHFVKQYSTDVAIAVLILLAAVTLFPERGAQRKIWWATMGSVAVWFSFTAIFILAGVVVSWIVTSWNRERCLSWRIHAIVPATWCASFLAEYWLLRQTVANRYLVVGWREGYMPLSLSDWLWHVKTFGEVFAGIDGTPAGPYLAVLSGALALLGCAFLWRSNARVLTLMLVPIGATLAASGLRKYPFSGRLVLFLYPIFILLVGAGLGWVLRQVPYRAHIVALVLSAIILLPPVSKAAYGLVTQPATQDVKGLLQLIVENRREGDLLWVDTSAGGAYEFYRQWDTRFTRVLPRGCAEDCHQRASNTSAYEAALLKASTSTRVWVLAAYIGSAEIEDERRLLERFDELGFRLDRLERRGATLTLYGFPASQNK